MTVIWHLIDQLSTYPILIIAKSVPSVNSTARSIYWPSCGDFLLKISKKNSSTPLWKMVDKVIIRTNNEDICKAVEFKNILVPVAGTEADDEAIVFACRLAKRAKSRIMSVYVITIGRSLPLEAEIESEIQKAEGILSHIEKVAEQEACQLQTDVLQARDAGPAIVDEAVERGADLILMGIEYKKHFGQFSLGEVVPYVLKNAPCRTILYQKQSQVD